MKHITTTALLVCALISKTHELTGNSTHADCHSEISVAQLLSWNSAGTGYLGGFRDRALQMTEDSDSEGLMIVSPESYGSDVTINGSIMTLRPATVLVIMLSASNGDGTESLAIPEGFDGNLANWTEGASDYFIAFHNAAHFRHPFVIRRSAGEAQLLEEATQPHMKIGQWHAVEAGRKGDRIWLKIDGETVLDVTDPEPLDGGHIAFRIRGSGTERASCFIKDVVIKRN